MEVFVFGRVQTPQCPSPAKGHPVSENWLASSFCYAGIYEMASSLSLHGSYVLSSAHASVLLSAHIAVFVPSSGSLRFFCRCP